MNTVHGFSKPDEAAKKRMEAFSGLPDEQIDLSDAPEWGATEFAEAVALHSIWKPRETPDHDQD